MAQHQAQPLPLHFSGSGSEYFRLWIVNVGLSIATLGIYSAWAKVRRNQYFYRHTRLAGAGFDYHGEPIAILKGRLAAFALFAAYTAASSFAPTAAAFILMLIMALAPWLLVRSLRFRMHNTSYRGLRFAFRGRTGPAYLAFLLWPLLAGLSLGLLWPFAQQRMAAYTRNNSSYGSAEFRFSAGAGAYYAIYLMTLMLGVVLFAGLMVLTSILGSNGWFAVEEGQLTAMSLLLAALGTYLGLLLFAYPYVTARLQNLVWGATTLGEHRFVANVSAYQLLGLMLSNVVLVVLTLGLYKPFADIRLARYRIEHLHVLMEGNPDDFVAGLQADASAAGDEMAEMFDFDIAL
ncbi:MULTISPECIES: YjgN family protein [Methylomonas]|uniref:YjgN family protein n=1 Tax=Methylomonas TaxID=416 RepID=UPI0007C8D7F4|nr:MULTISPECIES: YjgN family protein [Methylomonas]ANE56198.1 hypothetical protein AYM39_14095 [Methylomonas sp. DH-1]BBL57923.1 membrane protein [Methylomonas koyamae]